MHFIALGISSPLVFDVALDTHIRFLGVVHEMLEFRPVRAMAANAIQREVFVPLVFDLFSDRMRGMFLPIVTGSAQVDHVLAVEQENLVRGMRRMALRAIPLRYRLMFRQGFFLPFDGVRMAGSTYRYHGFFQESCLFRGMGTVAIQTGRFIHQGPVDPFLPERVVHHVIVASATQLKSDSLGPERIRRR
jgi:hypothetical protein